MVPSYNSAHLLIHLFIFSNCFIVVTMDLLTWEHWVWSRNAPWTGCPPKGNLELPIQQLACEWKVGTPQRNQREPKWTLGEYAKLHTDWIGPLQHHEPNRANYNSQDSLPTAMPWNKPNDQTRNLQSHFTFLISGLPIRHRCHFHSSKLAVMFVSLYCIVCSLANFGFDPCLFVYLLIWFCLLLVSLPIAWRCLHMGVDYKFSCFKHCNMI